MAKKEEEMHIQVTIGKTDIYGVDQRPSYRVKDKNCMIILADTEKVLNKNKQSWLLFLKKVLLQGNKLEETLLWKKLKK